MARQASPERRKEQSLWEIQKRERRGTVLEVARRLIQEKGYSNTTVDDIAATARLSTPTVYNYFGTKLDLLIAIYVEDRNIALGRIADIVAADWDRPIDCLMAILDADFHDEVIAVNHALWRQIAAAENLLTEGSERAALVAVQTRYADMARTAYKRMIDKSQLPAWADIEAGTELFVQISEGLYRRIISSGDKQFSHFKDVAERQLRILIAGLASDRS
ncbi:MAG: TetR/AcrR family transcriptional regulator [Hyphomicrobiaceae bacterium]|nr:TetR/AcrR family transcriptional regulator [Hyphomicrobiaceae bacterium]